MDKKRKSNNLLIIIAVIAIIILAVIVIYISISPEEDTQKTDLPDISEADYNSLQTSNDDFSALDEAVGSLE